MDSLILVLNCGSSSLKGAVINYQSGEIIIKYLAEKLNLPDAFLNIQFQGKNQLISLAQDSSHTGAIQIVMQSLKDNQLDQLIKAVGHRVVHGGERFKDSSMISDEVIHDIEQCTLLAPLHNPAHLLGIRAAREIFNMIPHVAVFDTAFHQTMPIEAFLYAIPYEYYQKYGIRKYGMHGTSYRYVSTKTLEFLKKHKIIVNHIVIAHLGNGASLCAIQNGQSVDTTMGLTPLEGLMMGTRSGDIDASIFSFLQENVGLNIQDTTNLLNKKSGLLGISGLSNDLRVIIEAAQNGNKRAQLAIDMFIYRMSKLTAGMAVAMGKIEALVFSGGIGEHSSMIRKGVLEKLRLFGFEIDDVANESVISGEVTVITKSNNPIALVVPTNEELMIARDTAQLVGLT